MFGNMMGGMNPMAMMSQMMGGGAGSNPMMNMMQNPQFQQMAQQIMSGQVSQGQMQNMLNQQMGGKAPDIGAVVKKIQDMQARGEVIVTNNREAFDRANQMGMGSIIRYSDKVKGFDVMSQGKYDIEYK